VLLLAPPGFGLRTEMYAGVAAAIAAAAAMAAAGSSGPAAAAAEGGGLLPVPSVGAGVAGSASGAAGSAARVAAAVAAAAGWAGLPIWRHSLLPGEEVTTIKCVELRETNVSESSSSAEQQGPSTSYIAVACGSSYGEDYPALGRLLLIEVRKHESMSSPTKIIARLVSGSHYMWCKGPFSSTPSPCSPPPPHTHALPSPPSSPPPQPS
jgi:hypothetical protein